MQRLQWEASGESIVITSIGYLHYYQVPPAHPQACLDWKEGCENCGKQLCANYGTDIWKL